MFLDRITPQATEGTVAEWLCEEGDEIKEGEDWVDIEAEKGVVPQNATQDFVVAKFLVEEKSGTFPLGTPIAITLDDIDDLAAFRAADAEGLITVDQPTSATEAPPADPAPQAVQTQAAPPAPAVETPRSKPEAPPAVAQSVPAAIVEPIPEQPSSAAAEAVVYYSPRWGTMAAKSALATKMAMDQSAYIEKYGSTGQQTIA